MSLKKGCPFYAFNKNGWLSRKIPKFILSSDSFLANLSLLLLLYVSSAIRSKVVISLAKKTSKIMFHCIMVVSNITAIMCLNFIPSCDLFLVDNSSELLFVIFLNSKRAVLLVGKNSLQLCSMQLVLHKASSKKTDGSQELGFHVLFALFAIGVKHVYLLDLAALYAMSNALKIATDIVFSNFVAKHRFTSRTWPL